MAKRRSVPVAARALHGEAFILALGKSDSTAVNETVASSIAASSKIARIFGVVAAVDGQDFLHWEMQRPCLVVVYSFIWFRTLHTILFLT